ncbi:Dr1-associated corepressor [Acropora cervicornis]|uniref:Dr1-associated corepressor n=1 Tax=Acropora cervicornis TaxID=6130 RepID=A0AAD9QWY2_ACRCE|nr:Dr1-associated corepressor [Acropora cervicornis]
MPSKKKKFNARFPPARIKKIMQTDEDVGKVAAAVPVIICILNANIIFKIRICEDEAATLLIIPAIILAKALEMFVQSLVERASEYTRSRNAKTMTPSHLKSCITSENQFDFLKDLVANVPDLPSHEEEHDGEPKQKRWEKRNALLKCSCNSNVFTPCRKRATRKPPAQSKEKKKSGKKKSQASTTTAAAAAPVAVVESDESDEELESEDEDSSSEGTSNHTNATNSMGNCSSSTALPSITLTRPSTDQSEESESSASMAIPMLGHIPGMISNSLDDEDDDYDS